MPLSAITFSALMMDEDLVEMYPLREANNPSRPRRKVSEPEKWKRNTLKKARVQGREVRDDDDNILVHERPMRDIDCLCDCRNKFTDWEKEYVHEQFRSKESHSIQDEYLRGCTSIIGEKVFRNGNKNLVYQHVLRFPRKTVPVCQKYFCSIHGISRPRLRAKVLNQGVDIMDRRGKHPNHRVVPDGIKDNVRIFLSALPASPSHYSLSDNPSALYMDPSWSMAALYRKFIDDFPGITRQDCKVATFRKIFNTEFNIKFGQPKKDICTTCELLLTEMKNIKLSRPFTLELAEQKKAELVAHLETANIFYKDYAAAKTFPPDNFALCFDYQKNIPIPSTQVSEEFYRSQLWVCNFGIKNLQTGETKMFVYSEHFACKGANEIVSCLLWYVNQYVPRNIKTLHVFCDNPVGQNKNRFVFAALQHLANIRFERVYMKFPVPGHSRMPIDGDFGRIGVVLKGTQKLCYPEDVVEVILKAQIHKPFEVVYVNHNFTNDMCSDGRPVVVVKDYKSVLIPLFPPLQQAGLHLQKVREILFCGNVKPLNNFTERFISPSREMNLFKESSTEQEIRAAFQAALQAYDDFIPVTAVKLGNVERLCRYVVRKPDAVFYDTLYTVTGDSRRYFNA